MPFGQCTNVVDISSDEFDEYGDFDAEHGWRGDQSEDEDYRLEVEEHEYITPGDTGQAIKIRLFLTEDEEEEFPWTTEFGAICLRNGVTVASALARYINREHIRHNFWQEMEGPSQDMCNVAFEVFDQYGTIKSKFRHHPVQRGTGVWGDELDGGPLFLIEEVHVTAPNLRRKGLGQKVVSLLLNKAERYCLRATRPRAQASTLHALVRPDRLTADVQLRSAGKSVQEILTMDNQAYDGALQFWRACGFRRIGASKCLAFSFNPQHQSRALAVASDFDPHIDPANDFEDEELDGAASFEEAQQRKDRRMRESLPLHHAALTQDDDGCRAFFASSPPDQAGWDRILRSGQTLVHITACRFMPRSLEWLLQNVAEADSLKTCRNADGYTPREALQENLDLVRSQAQFGGMTMNMSGDFKGYPERAVDCLSLLSSPDTPMLTNTCLRYGCTCGECLEGFLSPRMSISLIQHCKNLSGFLEIDIEYDDWVMENRKFLVHLGSNVRRELASSANLRQGFVNIFRLVTRCLKAKQVPSSVNIERRSANRAKWQPHTGEYLRSAGTQKGCNAAIRYLFSAVKGRDVKAGNGECQQTLQQSWSALPACRNDHEFDFVAGMCGYPMDVAPW
ncbi:hypothetical protein BJY00DRAFT_290635 [Aspergillus carlsbadensis]|nr:hypothetical protein BJY00DRAFT_290635 [Aspergillus carlsbadensis]